MFGGLPVAPGLQAMMSDCWPMTSGGSRVITQAPSMTVGIFVPATTEWPAELLHIVMLKAW